MTPANCFYPLLYYKPDGEEQRKDIYLYENVDFYFKNIQYKTAVILLQIFISYPQLCF